MRKKILLSLFLLQTFCVAVGFAQEISNNQAKTLKFINRKSEKASKELHKAVCKEDFVGESINLNVVEMELTDILNYITDEYGFNFVIDNSVKLKTVTLKAENISWNIVLRKILASEDLGIQCNGRILRIATRQKVFEESICRFPETESTDSLLYTDFIKLEKLPICTNNSDCELRKTAVESLLSTVRRRLTKRGQIEFDERSQTVIVTDVSENLSSIVNLVKLLDNEEFYNELKTNRK